MVHEVLARASAPRPQTSSLSVHVRAPLTTLEQMRFASAFANHDIKIRESMNEGIIFAIESSHIPIISICMLRNKGVNEGGNLLVESRCADPFLSARIEIREVIN